MNSSGDPERDAEAHRVERVYAGYRRSSRRRRAWAADNPGNQAIRAELLAAVLEEAGPELRSGGEVLDVGCGTGYWLEALVRAGVDPSRLTGVDLMSDRVSAAAARVPEATVGTADARALPFDDGRFGLVVLFTVVSSLEGSSDVRRALGEARRVLRGGGIFLCYEPRYRNPFNRRVSHVRDVDLDAAGISPRAERRLTLLPPIARRLGARTSDLYPRLGSVEPLRSHRLIVSRSPAP